MQRIDTRTVDLTVGEMAASEYFNDYISEKACGIREAAAATFEVHGYGPTLTPEFVDYLSEGTLIYAGGQVMPNDCQECGAGHANVLKVVSLRIKRLCAKCEDRLSSRKSEAGTTSRTVAIIQLLAVTLVGAFLGWWLSPRGEAPDPAPSSPGFAIEHSAWQEPYGGCKEAYRYVGSDGWWDCLRHDQVRAWYPMTPLFARVLRQHYRQVNVREPWIKCAYRFKGGTTVVLCPSGERYTS